MMKLNLIKTIEKHWWPMSLTMLVIVTIASLMPVPALPEVPGNDKTHHLVSYALVVLPIAFTKPRYWLFVLIGVVAWSGVIELTQPFVNRYGEWLDLVANVCGVLIGCIVGVLVKKSLIKLNNKPNS